MQFLTKLLVAGLALHEVSALPSCGVKDLKLGSCPPFNSTFIIKQYQLYPENADFDFNSCLLYIGNLFNTSVGVYDPYMDKMVDIIEFPGLSNNPVHFLDGLGIDQRTGLLSVIAGTTKSFVTNPPDVSGTNFVLQWDLKNKKIVYQVNITEISQGKYGGFQDVEQDPDGNVYVVGTFPGTILKIGKGGKTAPKVKPWYIPQTINTTRTGLAGLATKDWTLISNDNNGGRILKFDMRQSTGKPVVVPITPNYTLSNSDAIYLPPKYKDTVLLVAETGPGITVLRSKSGRWDTAEYLGTVPKNVPNTVSSVATTQIGDSLYMVVIPFGDTVVPGTLAGNRTDFPFYDITAQVEKLLEA